MRRIALFLLTNLAILVLLSIVCRLFGVDQWAAMHGYGGMEGLLIYAAVQVDCQAVHRRPGHRATTK
jgi:heat shock protein HtpX